MCLEKSVFLGGIMWRELCNLNICLCFVETTALIKVCLCVSAWPRYRVLRVQELGQYNLEILSADLSDDALYECQAPDAALRSRRAKLTVLSMFVLLCVCALVDNMGDGVF